MCFWGCVWNLVFLECVYWFFWCCLVGFAFGLVLVWLWVGFGRFLGFLWRWDWFWVTGVLGLYWFCDRVCSCMLRFVSLSWVDFWMIWGFCVWLWVLLWFRFVCCFSVYLFKLVFDSFDVIDFTLWGFGMVGWPEVLGLGNCFVWFESWIGAYLGLILVCLIDSDCLYRFSCVYGVGSWWLVWVALLVCLFKWFVVCLGCCEVFRISFVCWGW